ncbi:MAG TPA: alpha/beta fold hydrolase [Gaiellaceae bacterium]|jgi:pimeloyl-ACP methyl ester carboxylesterase
MTESKHRLNGFDDRELIVDGARLRYAVSGDGPPLVLVHGLGGTVENWRALAPALAERHRVLVPDLPGHGRSEALPEARHLDEIVDAVFALAEAERIEHAAWIGHSLGGTVSLRAAVRRPDAVRGVVLAAAAGVGSSTRLGRVTVTLMGLVEPGKAIAPHRQAWANSPLGRRVAFGWWGVGDALALDPAMAEAFFTGPAFHTNTRQAGQALLRTDPLAELERITCPVLCLWGASDKWVKPDDGFEYARRLGAQVRTIAGCGHLLIGERPDACLAAIEDFVASL